MNVPKSLLIQYIHESRLSVFEIEEDGEVKWHALDIPDLCFSEFRDGGIAVYDECIVGRPVGLVRHGELVLRDGNANGEMTIIERFTVVEPQNLVLRELFGCGPSDSVA